jgi:hypothetical protein
MGGFRTPYPPVSCFTTGARSKMSDQIHSRFKVPEVKVKDLDQVKVKVRVS